MLFGRFILNGQANLDFDSGYWYEDPRPGWTTMERPNPGYNCVAYALSYSPLGLGPNDFVDVHASSWSEGIDTARVILSEHYRLIDQQIRPTPEYFTKLQLSPDVLEGDVILISDSGREIIHAMVAYRVESPRIRSQHPIHIGSQAGGFVMAVSKFSAGQLAVTPIPTIFVYYRGFIRRADEPMVEIWRLR